MEMNKVCFLPWSGEFGWYLMVHVRRVHKHNADYKIVCCAPGEECLYPTANEFYHYTDFTPDCQKRHGKPISQQDAAEIKSYFKQRGDRGITYIDAAFDRKGSQYRYEAVQVQPAPQTARNIKTDILVAPRLRAGLDEDRRNLGYWDDIVRALADKGHKVGLIGSKELSYDINIDGVVRSWDISDTVDCIVDMMYNTGMVISSNSGMAHLAILCQTVPLCVLGHKGGPAFTWMKGQWSQKIPFTECHGGIWDDKDASIEYVLHVAAQINNLKPRLYGYNMATQKLRTQSISG